MKLPAAQEPHATASTSRFSGRRVGCLALATAAVLSGCVSIPRPLQGNFTEVDPAAATRNGATGSIVRWGGTIASTDVQPGQTCFQLVGRPLNEIGRPIAGDRSIGRFVACRSGFYEPQIFATGRSVTVTGRIVGFEAQQVGGYDDREPKLAADVVYLWPRHREVVESPLFW